MFFETRSKRFCLPWEAPLQTHQRENSFPSYRLLLYIRVSLNQLQTRACTTPSHRQVHHDFSTSRICLPTTIRPSNRGGELAKPTGLHRDIPHARPRPAPPTAMSRYLLRRMTSCSAARTLEYPGANWTPAAAGCCLSTPRTLASSRPGGWNGVVGSSAAAAAQRTDSRPTSTEEL